MSCHFKCALQTQCGRCFHIHTVCYVLAKVHACLCASTHRMTSVNMRHVCTHAVFMPTHFCNTRKARVEKERTRESEEQRVDLPQVLKLCINKQDLLDCRWHFCSVGGSVSSLIFNKTSQPSNAFPPSVSRY